MRKKRSQETGYPVHSSSDDLDFLKAYELPSRFDEPIAFLREQDPAGSPRPEPVHDRPQPSSYPHLQEKPQPPAAPAHPPRQEQPPAAPVRPEKQPVDRPIPEKQAVNRPIPEKPYPKRSRGGTFRAIFLHMAEIVAVGLTYLERSRAARFLTAKLGTNLIVDVTDRFGKDAGRTLGTFISALIAEPSLIALVMAVFFVVFNSILFLFRSIHRRSRQRRYQRSIERGGKV